MDAPLARLFFYAGNSKLRALGSTCIQDNLSLRAREQRYLAYEGSTCIQDTLSSRALGCIGRVRTQRYLVYNICIAFSFGMYFICRIIPYPHFSRSIQGLAKSDKYFIDRWWCTWPTIFVPFTCYIMHRTSQRLFTSTLTPPPPVIRFTLALRVNENKYCAFMFLRVSKILWKGKRRLSSVGRYCQTRTDDEIQNCLFMIDLKLDRLIGVSVVSTDI